MTVTARDVRAAVEAACPHLAFRVSSVGFTDLARAGSFCVLSQEWGMTKGGSAKYAAARAAVERFGSAAIVIW
jgi:hypothetical protein